MGIDASCWLPVARAVDPVFTFRGIRGVLPLPLLALTVHAACGKEKKTGWRQNKIKLKTRERLPTRTLCQISVLSRKSDILRRLDSIIIMFFVVAFIQYVSSLSFSLSLPPLSLRPPPVPLRAPRKMLMLY